MKEEQQQIFGIKIFRSFKKQQVAKPENIHLHFLNLKAEMEKLVLQVIKHHATYSYGWWWYKWKYTTKIAKHNLHNNCLPRTKAKIQKTLNRSETKTLHYTTDKRRSYSTLKRARYTTVKCFFLNNIDNTKWYQSSCRAYPPSISSWFVTKSFRSRSY